MTEEMSGMTEAAFLSAIRLHVTGNLALIRAAEEELIKNKVRMRTAPASTGNSGPLARMPQTCRMSCGPLWRAA